MDAVQLAEEVVEVAKNRMAASEKRQKVEEEAEAAKQRAEEARRAADRADSQAWRAMAKAEEAAAEVIAAEEALANSRKMSRAVRRAVNRDDQSQKPEQVERKDEARDETSLESRNDEEQRREHSLDEEEALEWARERGLSEDEAPEGAQAEVEKAKRRLDEAMAHKAAVEDEAQEVATQAVGFSERAAQAEDEHARVHSQLEAALEEERERDRTVAAVEARLAGTSLGEELAGALRRRVERRFDSEEAEREEDDDSLTLLAADADVLANSAKEAFDGLREQQQRARENLSHITMDEDALSATVPDIPEPASISQEEGEGGKDMMQREAPSREESVGNEQRRRPEAPRSSRHLAGAFFSAGRERDSDLRLEGVAAKVWGNMRSAVAFVGCVALGLFALSGKGHRLSRAREFVASYSSAAVDVVCRQASTSVGSPSQAVAVMREKMGQLSEERAGTSDVLWLLGSSVVAVPFVANLPGGSPVLGFLLGGAVIGPAGLGIIRNVHGVQYIAEFGVVFLLFNLGLELSYERLQSMAKYVFGLGTLQLLLSTASIATVAHFAFNMPGPSATIVGVGLAFSSTAVALQVLQDRGESGGRHGRATFSVLLMQDLAVVAVFMLVPLLAPTGSGQPPSGATIAKAMGSAVVKTGSAIVSIMFVGRMVLRPLYRRIADTGNAEIFAATTLLVVLGTSELTSALGLSNALGAFLSGLLIAETEFALQVESDIAPYRGLLLGLFFMTVGMTVDFRVLAANAGHIFTAMGGFLALKVGVVSAIGPLFGMNPISALRTAFFIAPGGEFAFVTFGEAARNGLLPANIASQLTIVVALSMAATPWLAMLGSFVRSRFGSQDMRSFQPVHQEVDDMRGHVIILGYGRVGQLIAQLLSEQLTEFVALDVRAERVAEGRAKDMPVFFGDAGSPSILRAVGANKAAAAVITLDTPSANYRAVWGLKKNFPHVKSYVRAHDVDHGLLLEKAGATAVVPEILEPSLQLASAVLSQLNLPPDDLASTLENFRKKHVQDLKRLRSSSSSGPGSQGGSGPAQGSSAASQSALSSRPDLSDVPREAVIKPSGQYPALRNKDEEDEYAADPA